MRLDIPQHRRLDPAERKIKVPIRGAPRRISCHRSQISPTHLDLPKLELHRPRIPRPRQRIHPRPPGYPSPSSFATLSNASPAASSTVRPTFRYRHNPVPSVSSVPPDTNAYAPHSPPAPAAASPSPALSAELPSAPHGYAPPDGSPRSAASPPPAPEPSHT